MRPMDCRFSGSKSFWGGRLAYFVLFENLGATKSTRSLQTNESIGQRFKDDSWTPPTTDAFKAMGT